jgi:prepilin-type processing-associated H-X9-DG protein
MHDVLRAQAVILRSLADELDAVADAMVRQSQEAIPTLRKNTEPPIIEDFEPDPDEGLYSPSDMGIAFADGHVDTIYHCEGERINTDAVIEAARRTAATGKMVLIDFGVKHKAFNVVLTPDDFHKEVAKP